MKHMHIGDRVPAVDATTLTGARVVIPSRDERLLHLQFRRFAGCPVCNLHMRAVATRIGELGAAGVREVAFFHSEAATMRAYQGDLPFDVIADPQRRFYDAFGVTSSLLAIADPRAWASMALGMFSAPSNALVGEGGHLGLPADFLVSPDGLVLAARYGVHADDQWSVDDVLRLARETQASSAQELSRNYVGSLLRPLRSAGRPRSPPRPAKRALLPTQPSHSTR